MKPDKKFFFKIHSWIGIRLSILFFIVCFSGTLATLSHEMDWLFIPEMRAKPSKSLATKNQIVKGLQEKYPNGRIQYWLASEEPYLCDIVYILEEGQRVYTFVNPYTGEIQGSTTLTFQRFFRDLHYFLFIPFQVGNYLVLVFGFLLLISLVTALFFYKKWYRKLFVLQTGKGALVFFRSLHRLTGVWSVPFTLLFSVTGIWYFVERTNIGGVSDIANPSTPKIEKQTIAAEDFPHFTYTIDYDGAAAVAQSHIPGLQVKDILSSSGPDQALYLNGQDDVPLVRNRANRVYLNPVTHEVIKVQQAKNLDTVTWLNDIADPLHFGYWGGLLTKVIWFIFGLGISFLVFSGIWISQKRKVKARMNKKARKPGVWLYVNWLVCLVMFGFMYAALIGRYEASVTAIIVISAGWLLFLFAAWYIFGYRLKKTARMELRASTHAMTGQFYMDRDTKVRNKMKRKPTRRSIERNEKRYDDYSC